MIKIILTGRLTENLNLRGFGGEDSKKWGTTSIAVKKPYKVKDGEDESDFFPLVVFGKQAQLMSDHCIKGCLLNIEGYFKWNNYQSKDGTRTVNSIQIVVEKWELLMKAQTVEKKEEQQRKEERTAKLDAFHEKLDAGLEITDEDLPF